MPGRFVSKGDKEEKHEDPSARARGWCHGAVRRWRMQQDEGQRNARQTADPEARKRRGPRRLPPVRRKAASSWPPPRRPASTRLSPARAPIRCWFPTTRRSTRRRPARSTPSPRTAAQLTGVITNLILPGTVLVGGHRQGHRQGQGQGRAGTIGGGTLTATKDGGKTVLTDAKGDKATITQADEQFSQWRGPSYRCRPDAGTGSGRAPARSPAAELRSS